MTSLNSRFELTYVCVHVYASLAIVLSNPIPNSNLIDPYTYQPWEPKPVLSIVVPKNEILSDQVSRICQRIFKPSQRPYAYIHRPGNKVARLWNARRNAWPLLLATVNDPKSAFSSFLQRLAAAYVKVFNLVLGFSPKSKIADLRCEIDEAMHRVDRHEAGPLFVETWNEVVKNLPRAPTITCYVRKEWRWVLGHVLAGCKRAVAQSVREQLEPSQKETDDTVYVGDKGDARHAYYCVGAVWRSVMTAFARQSRITTVIQQMFLDKETAQKFNLPVEEVSSR